MKPIKELKIYNKKDGLKKVKSVARNDAANVTRIQKQKSSYLQGAAKGETIMMYMLWTKNTQHGSMQNPYGLEMLRKGNKSAYIIPIKESINEAKYTHKYPSITAMSKDYDRIFGSTSAARVKIISGSKREATGKRSQPAYITIEGDKKLIDAYKKIAFKGRGSWTDVLKSVKESVNEVTMPFSNHLRGAQEEIEFMIGEHPEASEEGVYKNPKQAIKFLTIAQKALRKIT
jgi:hypothetical protein